MPAAGRVRVSRELTDAERHMAIEAIDSLLNGAKDRLERAILDEQHRAVRRWQRGMKLRMHVSADMLIVLRRLYREGARHARLEMRSMGVTPGRAFAVDPVEESQLAPTRARLEELVGTLGVKVAREALTIDIGTLGASAVRRQLMRVLGARDAAGRVVSGAFDSGLAVTYEDADSEGLFSGWQYTAVLDGGVCPECASKDGRTYPTLDLAYGDLPGFGPNPLCFGNGRCRCRLLPLSWHPTRMG